VPAVHVTQLPPLHTSLVPHDMPSGTFDALLQTETPVEHEVVPFWQTFPPGLHTVPDVHDVHAPLSQTRFEPHDAPFERFVTFAVQAETPVAHDVRPVWQAAGEHDVPAVHAVHVPLSHTMFDPHDVPFVTFVAVPPHVCDPDAHVVVPLTHALPPGWHVVPDTHAMQFPPLQTWLLPQDIPSGKFAVNEHVELPVVHVVIPVWHGLLFGLQLAPAVHAVHAPLSHTWFVPQVMPFALLPLDTQTDVPVEHDVWPARQTLPPGLHATPAVHAVHVPPLHTWLVPHDVPSVTLVGLGHVAVPVPHDVTPVWQTLPAGLQLTPAEQAPQPPLPSHTWLLPQAVPGGAAPLFVHTGAPELQST
jgi:hypothetical protein